MKSLFRVLPAAIMFLAVAVTSTAAQVMPAESQIAASGRGERRVKPTRAVVVFTVLAKGLTAAAAAAENARLVASTMRALAAAGVRSDDVTNSGYNVAPDYEFSQSGRKQNGFAANNSIRVEVAKVADLGKIIDGGLEGGASQVGSARFSGEKMEEARRDALKSAVEAARLDAEAMAEAAGGKIGRLISLTSSNTAGSTFNEVFEGRIVGASSVGGTAINANDLTVVATASGRWEFVPRR